jgi:23S rRNA pseudouridine2605 synthase
VLNIQRMPNQKPSRRSGSFKTEKRDNSRSKGPNINSRSSKDKKAQNQGAETPTDIRLNKYIANAGICSRRDADVLISEGKIKVNGQVVTELGLKVKKSDKVVYQGKRLSPEKPVYVLLNKPKDFITTVDDPQNRKTVMKLIEKAAEERIYPVGRLDRMTTGLLLFTNDGELAKRLMHPSHQIKKIYQVEIDKPITKADFEQILEGVKLEDGVVPVDQLAILEGDNQKLGIEIHVGRNRIIRRLFEALDYRVEKLDRVVFGGLTKKDLSRGKFRHLSPREVQNLKNMVQIK